MTAEAASGFTYTPGGPDVVSGPTHARWQSYTGVYGKPYTLDQETA